MRSDSNKIGVMNFIKAYWIVYQLKKRHLQGLAGINAFTAGNIPLGLYIYISRSWPWPSQHAWVFQSMKTQVQIQTEYRLTENAYSGTPRRANTSILHQYLALYWFIYTHINWILYTVHNLRYICFVSFCDVMWLLTVYQALDEFIK